MPLVEIVQHDAMSDDTRQRLAAFCRAIDKLPVPVAGTPGFLVNRVLFPYLLEAATAFAEGIPGAAIDKAATRFGMPMGPIELIDTVGLDVAAGVARELSPFLGLEIPASLSHSPGSRQARQEGWPGLVHVGGRQAGQARVAEGLQGSRRPGGSPDPAAAQRSGRGLHDGVVADADLLDAGVIFGTGFAPFRGGPIQYIRDTGADAVLAKLQALQGRHGARFAPRPGWDAPALRG